MDNKEFQKLYENADNNLFSFEDIEKCMSKTKHGELALWRWRRNKGGSIQLVDKNTDTILDCEYDPEYDQDNIEARSRLEENLIACSKDLYLACLYCHQYITLAFKEKQKYIDFEPVSNELNRVMRLVNKDL